jgi:hypothetical protein
MDRWSDVEMEGWRDEETVNLREGKMKRDMRTRIF